MILKYIRKKFLSTTPDRFNRRKQSLSLIEILIVIGILTPILAFLGSGVLSENQYKMMFEHSCNELTRQIGLAGKCCVYYDTDVHLSIRKEEKGIYVSEIKATKLLPEKTRRLTNKLVILKGIESIDTCSGNPNLDDSLLIFFDGSLGGASVRKIILKGKAYEKTITFS
ncbi:MAG: hypothetical protein RRZ67_01295 [Victivallaceae bacterium]